MARLWSFLAKVSAIFSAATFLKAEIKGLDISLISENSSISAGKPFTVGLHLQHHPGYHTYWINPGIVGIPTSIKWKLPEGFTASPIQWPFPERSSMAGHPCYGYERNVVLMATITPLEEISAQTLTFSASAQWMCCAQNCHPGFQDFNLSLPVTGKAKLDSNTVDLFKKARAELPQQPPVDLNVRLLSKVDAAQIELVIKTPIVKQAYFFSEDGQTSSDQIQKTKTQKNGHLELTLLRSEFSPKGATMLPGILRLDSSFYKLNLKYPEK